jgi:ABC-type amino acid transport substrate-binding protein
VRINFTDPYLKIGLMAAIRAEDADKYDSLESIMTTYENVGVIPGTTGDVFVQRKFPHARRMAVSSAKYAALELKRRRIDVFVYDGPAIAWLVSENEADLAGVWEPFNTEYLAWGVRRDDQLLLQAANGILRKWKQDGTLRQVLERWLPYLDLLDKPIP